MNVLDLFSGIGGFSLGLERAGMRTVAFCEIEPYCQAVLRKHWPDVPIFGDVRTLTAKVLANTDIGDAQCRQGKRPELRSEKGGEGSDDNASGSNKIDLICGGFPCQDISVAGKGAGIEGERSGLWSEYARIIGEVRPRYVIVENVSALLGRGLGRALGDLAAIGYDAEWHCIPASAVGAPHRRDRVWIVAHAAGAEGGRIFESRVSSDIGTGGLCNTGPKPPPRHERIVGEISQSDWWFVEPNVGRVAHGVPFRVDRLRSLGNAIVPQIAEIIGKAIMASHEQLGR